MTEKAARFCRELFANVPALLPLEEDFRQAVSLLCGCFRQGGKLLVCGNGGSAADSEHIVGELMKGFLCKRPLTREERAAIAAAGCPDPEAFADNLQRGLPAVSMVSQTALMTAFLNDVKPDMLFAQQVFAYGRPGDVLLALSTSGNSADVVNAAYAAKARGMEVLSFTGEAESRLSEISRITFRAPSRQTFRVQEYHLALYHGLCGCVELTIFPE